MITAISNTPANADLADRFERAALAAHLTDTYGADDWTAAQTLADLTTSHTIYEGDRITFWTRDLIEFRAEVSR
jgi:hypothetical protein